jgi:hypothetical protein
VAKVRNKTPCFQFLRNTVSGLIARPITRLISVVGSRSHDELLKQQLHGRTLSQPFAERSL